MCHLGSHFVVLECYKQCYLGIKDLDGQLGAYPYESLKTWYSLTNHITEAVMKRLVLNTYYSCIIG